MKVDIMRCVHNICTTCTLDGATNLVEIRSNGAFSYLLFQYVKTEGLYMFVCYVNRSCYDKTIVKTKIHK